MSMPTGEGTQSGAPGAQSGTGTEGTGTTAPETQSQTGAQSGTETGQQAPQQDTVSRADFEAMKRQLQAADQRRSASEAELKKLQDAQLSETEKTKRDLEAAQREKAELEAQLKDQKINNAFLTDNTYDWHDPRAALRIADLKGVEIKEDGTVTGLKEALKAVADSNPWMLKPKETETTQPTKTGGVTGVSGAGNNNASGADRAGLEKRFPQLRGRVS